MALDILKIALLGFITPLDISLLSTRGYFEYSTEIPPTDADINIFDIAIRGYKVPIDPSLLTTKGYLSWQEEPTPEDTEIIKIIKCIAHQYADSPLLECRIKIAESLTGQAFGDCYDYAVALRVCHMFALDEINGGNLTDNSGVGYAGTVTSAKEGDLSESRGFVGGNPIIGGGHADLQTTRWGLELVGLMNSCLILPMTSLV